MTDLFVIGTSHPLQCGDSSCSHESILAFEVELRSVCKKLNIQRIVEEMSDDGLKRHGVLQTVGKRIADELDIPHQNIDLKEAERLTLWGDDSPMLTTVLHHSYADQGVSFREAFSDLTDAIRERCWALRMLSKNEWPTLFICGAEHSQSIRKIWRALGLDSKVIHLDYVPQMLSKINCIGSQT